MIHENYLVKNNKGLGPGIVVHVYKIPTTWEVEIGGSQSEAGPGQK
jgi:hypothetical protein